LGNVEKLSEATRQEPEFGLCLAPKARFITQPGATPQGFMHTNKGPVRQLPDDSFRSISGLHQRNAHNEIGTLNRAFSAYSSSGQKSWGDAPGFK
jgi:hypothetical protein